MNIVSCPQRGEVYFLDFAKNKGHSMQNRHPALVIQNNTANRYSGVIIVVPITSNLKVAQLPVGVLVNPPEGGLPKPSAIHCGQMHTVDRNEFTSEKRVGRLSPEAIQKVDKALKTSLDLI